MQQVRAALDQLKYEFLASPGLFYTEHDLHSRLYHLIQEGLGYQTVVGCDAAMHYLIHHEYPTPFRCCMRGHGFRVAGEDERTDLGGKFVRGHYDLVVFNPRFLSRVSVELARGQRYATLLQEMPAVMASLGEPPILAGVEMVYQRTTFASAKEAERWCNSVEQDHAKLKASEVWQGLPFMDWHITLAASAVSQSRYHSTIHQRLQRPGIDYWEPR